MIEDLEALFASNDIFKAKVVSVDANPSDIGNVKTPAKLEQLITKHHQTKPGDLLIIEWGSLEDDVLVSSDRTIFISDKAGESTD